jgi:hypothetical protein
VLYLLGRPAGVELIGDPDAVARVENAKRGI